MEVNHSSVPIKITRDYPIYINQAAYIICKKEEAEEIKISKFGGKIPCLDPKEIPANSDNYIEVLAQIYVPGLPKAIKKLFPSDLQDALIVLFFDIDNFPIEAINNIETRIYHGDEIDKLIYVDREDTNPAIESAIFTTYKYKAQTFDVADHASYTNQIRSMRNAEDQQENEQYSFYTKESNCFFGGYPFYCQDDDNPGPDYTLILSLMEDHNFSMIWGDAGNAQIWLRNDDSHQFILTWACC